MQSARVPSHHAANLVARHTDWMAHALTLAAQAPLTGDVPVGALIVDEHATVLAARHNERELHNDPTGHPKNLPLPKPPTHTAPTGHAEILELRDAAAARADWRLTDCTLIVTLEPCIMCAGAIVAARIPTVVFGAWDDKAGAAGSVYDLLRDRRLNHRVEVFAGVNADAAGALLTAFFEDQARRTS